MIKNRVEIEKDTKNQVSFFFISEKYGKNLLFKKDYSKVLKGVYEYFQCGRSINELYSFHGWKKNPRLDDTIKRVLKMCRYVEKEQEREAAMTYMPVGLQIDPDKEAKYRRLAAEYCR